MSPMAALSPCQQIPCTPLPSLLISALFFKTGTSVPCLAPKPDSILAAQDTLVSICDTDVDAKTPRKFQANHTAQTQKWDTRPSGQKLERSFSQTLRSFKFALHQCMDIAISWASRKTLKLSCPEPARKAASSNRGVDPRHIQIPQFVLDYAPLVYLHSEEEFWPGDISEHLAHVAPHLNYTLLHTPVAHLNLTNLDELNEWEDGRFIFLKSEDDVETRPDWLTGKMNIPSILQREVSRIAGRDTSTQTRLRDSATRLSRDESYRQQQRAERADPELKPMSQSFRRAAQFSSSRDLPGGRSNAPAILILVEKSYNIVDAFWFYFYSYNLGNKVFNVRFGNHVGDWEHVLVRFLNGEPKAVFFSEHYWGEAYTYQATEKIGKRPVAYSAVGTHAMYGTAGDHQYVLPFGLLKDVTDKGPLWDPLLNVDMYSYNLTSNDLQPSHMNPEASTAWFHFAGHWGDKFYPLSDPRQYEFAGQYHYVDGPLGPKFKNLGRASVCQGLEDCTIKNWLMEDNLRTWPGAAFDVDPDDGSGN